MSFLYPSFLWALGVLAIPVIIHLFNFRRTTRIFFSNNRFLKQVKEASTAKRKLKHYLILASRILFLFFLVMVFCQPVIPAREQMQGNSIILYLDNSQSMSAPLEDNTRALDAGTNFVRTVVEQFPTDTRYKLITNDFAPFSNSYKTGSEILELLSQIRLSPVSRSMAEVEDRIRQDGQVQGREIFWISDFQKSTLGNVQPASDSTVKVHLVPVSFPALPNVFVDTIFLENPFVAGGEKNVMHVRVRNDGQRDVEQLNLKLLIHDIQAGGSTIAVKRGSFTETTFDLAAGLVGLQQARITFNDFPVSFDNEFYFALNFTDKISVMEIRESEKESPVGNVYGNTAIFSFAGYSVRNVDYSKLAQADFVVVNGLNSLDGSLAVALRDYINGGGSVLVIPGGSVDAQNLQTVLQLPSLKVNSTQPLSDLDRPDFANPFFENVFEEQSTSMAMPKATPAIDWGTDRSAILRFKNGAPFLSRFDQHGKLYLLACALQPGLTDFYNHALFVPVMYRLAASGKRTTVKPYYSLKESFINLRLEDFPGEEQLKLVGQEELIPSQRRVGDQVLIDIPKFSMTQGFYKVILRNDTVNLLAFNPDKAESLMEQYQASEVKELLGNGNQISIFQASSVNAFSNEIKERYLGTPLWKYALMLALLFLLAEILLIRFLK